MGAFSSCERVVTVRHDPFYAICVLCTKICLKLCAKLLLDIFPIIWYNINVVKGKSTRRH